MGKARSGVRCVTILQARKALGSLANNVSDEQLLEEIKLAENFKDAFFHHIKSPNVLDRVKNTGYTVSEDEKTL